MSTTQYHLYLVNWGIWWHCVCKLFSEKNESLKRTKNFTIWTQACAVDKDDWIGRHLDAEKNENKTELKTELKIKNSLL